VVEKYNQLLLAKIRQLGLIKVQQGQPFQHQLLEEIDKELIEVQLKAEKQCWKIKAGGVAWPPDNPGNPPSNSVLERMAQMG